MDPELEKRRMILADFAGRFAPMQKLALYLLEALPEHDDGSHDLAHLARVWATVRTIHAEEGGDLEILLAATLMHDAVQVEKTSPERAQASRMAATFAKGVLKKFDWPEDRIEQVAHAIAAHSNSGKIAPRTIEARILRDADRLDAIGAVGIARCFYTGGRNRQTLYDIADPRANQRSANDSQFTLDHILTKLLYVANSISTPAGRRLAAHRQSKLEQFVEDFLAEG